MPPVHRVSSSHCLLVHVNSLFFHSIIVFLPHDSADNFDTIYVKPYTRWGTYAIGLVLGWIILKQYKPPK
ncbi:hypothetical protein CLF_113393, partial [Clonorchis sinensis]